MNCDREKISSLVDGQLTGRDFDLTLSQMAGGEARESWRVYHLIGDVMRSPELAAHGQGAEAFMDRLRTRLTAENRVLGVDEKRARKPAPDLRRSAANDQVFRWKLVAGVASMAAVGVLSWGLLAGQGTQPKGGLELASLSTPVAAPAQPNSRGAIADTGMSATGGATILRDPELDQLLAAHRQVAGDAAFGQMAGFLHNTTLERSTR